MVTKLATILFLGVFPVISAQKNVVGKYRWQMENFSEGMDLNADSTFSYSFSFSLGSTRSVGKWRMSGDTVLLSDYQKPWTIDSVREQHIGFLKDTVVVRICTLDEPLVPKRRNNGTYFYVDGIRVAAKQYDSLTNTSIPVRGFRLKADGILYTTDDFGYIRIPVKAVSKMSCEYDRYSVKAPRSNYFTIYLDNFPICVSPMVLTCDRWIHKKRRLIRTDDSPHELKKMD